MKLHISTRIVALLLLTFVFMAFIWALDIAVVAINLEQIDVSGPDGWVIITLLTAWRPVTLYHLSLTMLMVLWIALTVFTAMKWTEDIKT